MTQTIPDQIVGLRDEAVPGEITEIIGQNDFMRTARVKFFDANSMINLAYTPEARVGDHVLVHQGFAINVISAERAETVLADLLKRRQLDQLTAESSISDVSDASEQKDCQNKSSDHDDDPQQSCICC